MLPVDVVDLDGQLVAARALGWDGTESDATDWSLDRSDLPLLTQQIGTLTVNYVDDLDYTQFVVNGIPVDPASVAVVDYTGHTTLVAAGWEDVARDSDGKWTSGPGGIGIEATTPPPQTPGQIPMWTPGQVAGQKAAATKKAKAAAEAKHLADQKVKNREIKAQVAAEMQAVKDKNAHIDEREHDANYQANKTMTQALDLMIQGGYAAYPSEETLLNATPAVTDAYLKVALGDSYAKKITPGMDSIAKAKIAVDVSNQHLADTQMLKSIGYLNDRPALAVDARRAVLRETGERKPTGGPGSGQAVHTFYGVDAIESMPPAKQAAVLVHHTGGSYTMKQALELAPDTLTSKAINVDSNYKLSVGTLTSQGVDPASIPHSNAGAQYMIYGSTKGLPSNTATVSKPVTNSATALGKPANWAQMSPGKKAAWTKKYNQGKAGQADAAEVSAMKPADWASMTPGKKAAWTKKHNLGGVTAVYADPKGVTFAGSLGTMDHVTHTYDSNAEVNTDAVSAIDHMPKDDHGDEATRIYQFTKATSVTQQNAWNSYTGSGYTTMNQALKNHGKNYKGSTKVNALRDAIKDHGSPAPKVLYRGKKKLGSPELNLKIGDEFEDPKFGSWTSSKVVAKNFAGLGFGGSVKSTFYRILDTHGTRSAPSSSGEHETLLPPGTRFKVLGIREFISSKHTAGLGTSHVRIFDLEVAHAPYG